jgi:ATP-dependent Clp protease adaptor protein ClpS
MSETSTEKTTDTAEPSQVATLPARKPKPKSGKTKPRELPPYHVILYNDDDHSYEYVMEMLLVVFGHPFERGMQMAKEVDETGRVIVLTTHKEKAELKRDQIHAYGADPRVACCAGSMSAAIEPAEG